MATVTVSQGVNREGAYQGEDGTFLATFIEFGEIRTGVARATGKEFRIQDWAWAIDEAPDDANLVWGGCTPPKARPDGSYTVNPMSKWYGWTAALYGGKFPDTVDTKSMPGRQAFVTVTRDDEGWTRISGVAPLPKGMQKQGKAPAPVEAAPTAEGDDQDGLPF